MLSVIVLDAISEDLNSISSILKMAYTQQELPIKRLEVVNELSTLQNTYNQVRNCNLFIVSCKEIRKEYISYVQFLRRNKEEIFIIFIVEKDTDISLCLRPSVRTSSILFIPLDKIQVYQTIREVYSEYLRISSREEQSLFVIKSGSEYFPINIEDISFFEARGKKIAVKTRGQEILFYSNFETILKQLPNWFVRNHKGFVVNTKQIEKANFTEMTLTLMDNCKIPISRTYRDELRAIINSLGV